MIGFAKTIGAIYAAMTGGNGVQNGQLSLDQAIRIAETNAFSIRLQKSVIEKNHQKVVEARGNLGPSISLGASYTRYDQALTTSFGPGTPPVIIRPIDATGTTATLNWPIDIAGDKVKLLRANEALKKASDMSLSGSYNDTRLNVRQAYFAVLRAQAQIDVDNKALDDAKGRLDQGQKQFDQLQVAKLDVTRYQAAVAQAQADLISAQDSLTLANYAFNLTLARPIQTPVSLVDIEELPPVPFSDDQLVGTAEQTRPEILSAIQNMLALGYLTKATESGLHPSLNMQIQYQRAIDPQGFSTAAQTTVGTLLLNVPIFDSGVTRAKVREAREDEKQARINLEQTRLTISQEVRNAISNITSARARFDNASSQVKLAEEVFRLAKVKQDAGAGTYYEVIDAESQLTLARNGLISARYDYLAGFSQLQRAVGSDSLQPGRASNRRNSK